MFSSFCKRFKFLEIFLISILLSKEILKKSFEEYGVQFQIERLEVEMFEGKIEFETFNTRIKPMIFGFVPKFNNSPKL